jgi:hypothetical protein
VPGANSLSAEFLGDYNNAVAMNGSAIAVWNDVRNTADCPAVDAYRQSLVDNAVKGTPKLPKPAADTDCPAKFGNSDIFSATVTDPTP